MSRGTISGVILAGGQGRRMGGPEKDLQYVKGRPPVQWVLERLKPQVDAVLISANRNLARCRDFGCPLRPDRIRGHAAGRFAMSVLE